MKGALLLLGVVVAPLIPYLRHHRQIPTQDAALVYNAILETARTGTPKTPEQEYAGWHVPTYLYVSAGVVRILGESPSHVRLVGLFGLYLTALFVWLAVRRLASGNWAWLAAFVYVTQPLVVQGAIMIDFETTLLPPAVAFFLWSWDHPKPIWIAAATLAVGIAKESFVLPLLAAVTLHFIIRRELSRRWLFMLIGGIASFIVLWLVSHGASKHNATHLWEYIGPPWNLEKLVQRVRYIALISAWLTPAFLLGLLWILIQSWRAWRQPDSFGFALDTGALLFLAVTAVVGAAWWFPRYYSPALPFLVAAIVVHASRHEILSLKQAAVLGGAALIVHYVAGDPAVMILHDTKLAAVEGRSLRPELMHYVAAMLAGSATLILPKLLRAPLVASLPALVIGAALGLQSLQWNHELTGYGYGCRGAEAVLTRLNASLKPGEFVAGPHEMAMFSPAEKRMVYERTWNDPDELEKEWAADPRCRAIIGSLYRNSQEQFRRWNASPVLQERLKRDYTFERIGDFWVWWRR